MLITEEMFDPSFLAAYRSAIFDVKTKSSKIAWTQQVNIYSVHRLEFRVKGWAAGGCSSLGPCCEIRVFLLDTDCE